MTAPLNARDAVAAIILNSDGQYLLQLRDEKPGIFFPGHWSLFGGAIDDGEEPYDTLKRELCEELALEVKNAKIFGRFDFDLTPSGRGRIMREFYEVTLTQEECKALNVQEGQGGRFFTAGEMSELAQLVPYDAFALWLHANSNCVRFSN